jgi:arabinofuranosyltransferase
VTDADDRTFAARRARVLAAVAGVVLAAHAWTYRAFVTDDALISLRYARRLLDGHGLTWTDGERAEGYSNLLWVLACAALGKLGIDLIDATRVLGVACSVAVIAALGESRAHEPRSRPLSAFGAGLLYAASGSVACWAVGGLEQPMVCSLLAWALVLLGPVVDPVVDGPRAPRREHLAGLLLGLLCITRVDGPILAGVVLAGVLAARRADRAGLRVVALLGAYIAAFTLAQVAFRIGYHGDAIPSTVRAKATLSGARLPSGARYVGGALLSLWALTLAGAAGLYLSLRTNRHRARALLWAVPFGLWCIYLTLVGYDAFPAWRLFMPAVVLLALLAGAAFAHVHERRLAVGGVGLLLVSGAFAATQWTDKMNAWSRTDNVARDGLATGVALRKSFGARQPLVAVAAAGGIPYASGLPSLDMLGLADQHIARTHPKDFGSGLLGHELGDGRYVLDRKPDLVLFCGGAGGRKACYRSGREMEESPEFRADYDLVALVVDEAVPPALAFVRRESPLVGITRAPDRVVVPGQLFATTMGSRAVVLPDSRWAARSAVGAPAHLRRARLEAGRWVTHADTLGAPVVFEIKRTDGAPVAAGPDGLAFTLDADATVSVLAGPLQGASAIAAVTFARAP